MKPHGSGETGRSVILMGMKHTGKSSLGKLYAERYACPFFDLDDLTLEQAGELHIGSVRELYREHGREVFMDFEWRAAVRLSASLGNAAAAALGGGTIENPRAMDALEGRGLFVHLACSPEPLFRRIIASGLPPFLSPDHPYEDFLSLYERRTRLYEARADLRVDLEGASVGEAFNLLEIALKGVFDGR